MLIRHIWDLPNEEKTQEKILFDVGETETIALGRVTVEPGGTTQEGFHPDEEEVYVILKGRARLMVGDDIQVVGPGDTVYVPRNHRHRMACISEENLEYLYFANWPKEIPPVT